MKIFKKYLMVLGLTVMSTMVLNEAGANKIQQVEYMRDVG